jgi:hypothetical protein
MIFDYENANFGDVPVALGKLFDDKKTRGGKSPVRVLLSSRQNPYF